MCFKCFILSCGILVEYAYSLRLTFNTAQLRFITAHSSLITAQMGSVTPLYQALHVQMSLLSQQRPCTFNILINYNGCSIIMFQTTTERQVRHVLQLNFVGIATGTIAWGSQPYAQPIGLSVHSKVVSCCMQQKMKEAEQRREQELCIANGRLADQAAKHNSEHGTIQIQKWELSHTSWCLMHILAALPLADCKPY